MSLTEYASFVIPGIVDVVEGNGGLPVVSVESKESHAEIYLQGAHITRFDVRGGKPLLWTSPATPYQDGKPIRGGIPICFPWFGPHRTNKDFPLHGCVRFRTWKILSTAVLSDGRVRVCFEISSDEGTRSYWPHEFDLTVTFTFGSELEVILTATNTDREPFVYDDCLHTYFAVGDVGKATVWGLDGVGYIDRGNGDLRFVQKGPVTLSGEVVHAFVKAPTKTKIEDAPWKRTIHLEHTGTQETIVWNPGEAAAAKNPEMASFSKEFLCVEAANCLDHNVMLLPGCSHSSVVRYYL